MYFTVQYDLSVKIIFLQIFINISSGEINPAGITEISDLLFAIMQKVISINY